MSGSKKLTIVQLNDSHGYMDTHQEMFWRDGQAIYRPAGGYARIATLVKQMRATNEGRMLEENLERTFARDPYDQMGGYVKRGLGLNVYFKIENPLGQRIQHVFVGNEEVQPARSYPTAFVTEQGVARKYGRQRENRPDRAIDAMRAYLAKHRPLRAELKGTFVAV